MPNEETEIVRKPSNFTSVAITPADKDYIVKLSSREKPQYVLLHECIEAHKIRHIELPPPAPPVFELTEPEKLEFIKEHIKLVPVDYLKGVILVENEICFTCTHELMALLQSKLDEVNKMDLTRRDSTAQEKWSDLTNFALLFLLNNTTYAKEWRAKQHPNN